MMLVKERTRLITIDKNIRVLIKNTENKEKKQAILSEVWTTYRWIKEYLTTEDWEIKKTRREQEQQTQLQEWISMTRAEKIESLLSKSNSWQNNRRTKNVKTMK